MLNFIKLISSRTVFIFFGFTAFFLLSACNSTPIVRGIKSTDSGLIKNSKIIFFYQEAKMKSQEIYRNGIISASENETGFSKFGEALVSQVPEVFQKNGVSVVHASVVPPGEWRRQSSKTFGEIGPRALEGVTVITVTPRGGQSRATNHAATIDMTFEIRAIDSSTAKVLWTGAIDTSTWTGRDFISKNIKGTRFDEAYATKFLESAIKEFKANGLL